MAGPTQRSSGETLTDNKNVVDCHAGLLDDEPSHLREAKLDVLQI
jgi:hypothetical protein